ncbi:MAG: hypothetical protein ABSF83_01380 [Nitrososphaerales archaeon]
MTLTGGGREPMDRRAKAVVAAVIIALGVGLAALLLYETGQPPFCAGSPPAGDCPGSFSYTFQITVDYSGQWQVSYYGFHGVGAPPDAFSGTGNYTGGSYGGTGTAERGVTLSGPDTSGLTLCVQAEKLDSSGSSLALRVDSSTNSTALPSGRTSVCIGVVQ